MPRYIRLIPALLASLFCVATLSAQEFGKATVELRWVEGAPIEGLTEKEGFQTSCDPDDIAYPHKKPALVLTAKEVEEAVLTEHDFSASGLSRNNYMVKIHLTKAAREKLAATRDSDEMGLLTITVDGKNWGVHRYEKKDGPGVPVAARAETFTPSIGFFSSRFQAQRVVDALK